jgi:plasmid stabilization system protein ParE
VNRQLEFHPDVDAESNDAYLWYEQRKTGLGTDFLDEVERVLAAMTSNPARYGFAKTDIREALLIRFPYAIYYRVLSNRIRVLAVFHTSRDPADWQSRT